MVKPLESSALRGASKVAAAKTMALKKALVKKKHQPTELDQIGKELDEVILVLRLICVILASTRVLPKEIVEWLGTTLPKAVKYQNPLGPPR